MSIWLQAARADRAEQTKSREPPPRTNPTDLTKLGRTGESSDSSELSGGSAAEIGGCPDLEIYEERAAIIEHDGGFDRETAGQRAAAEQGFASSAALLGAASNNWLARLKALAPRCSEDRRGHEHLRAAIDFLEAVWASRALALGWGELELVGVHPRAPWHRFDYLGIAFTRQVPIAVTSESMAFRAHDGHILQERRRPVPSDPCRIPVWELSP